jgi:hypothetical protein
MNKAVFWNVTPCGSCKNRRFANLIASIIRLTRIGQLRTLAVTNNRRTLRKIRLLVTANVLSAPILITLMKEAMRSSERSVLTRTMRRNILEDRTLTLMSVCWDCFQSLVTGT